ncbi:Uncharacterised protein [Anaerostipes hadrus]|uniref:Bacterial Ig domain-containing protein n=1 Tax=Anaerostipes hadrus TaxID=649756 RepID=A0A174LI48_ANAHA|nr:hypothetical protein [Anaerostipes hadrus]CUP24034.1 Uncharacterised protein [Anaerostipes hadrus]
MRRRRLTIGLLSMMMAASVAFGIQGNDVHAASKKLSVNRVYENATRINGKTRKKNIVRVKIGKKTYKAKANKKGKFTVKIPRVAAGKKYTLKSYKGKKLYKTKKVYVIAKKLKINKYTPNSKSISGYTRPSYKVKVKIAGKTYVKKASAVTGYWKVKPDNNKKIGTTVSVKVVNTKGKTVTETKKHVHDYKAVYKTVHHNEVGHYETVEVPAWDSEKETSHYFCLQDGFDLTQDYLDSVKNKTYPDYDEETKKEWGYTEENGYPKNGYDALVFTNNNMEIDKFAPTESMYMGLHGWNGEHDGHNVGTKLVKIKIHHEATTKQVWKVDQKSYDEKVLVSYNCDCGSVKNK